MAYILIAQTNPGPVDFDSQRDRAGDLQTALGTFLRSMLEAGYNVFSCITQTHVWGERYGDEYSDQDVIDLENQITSADCSPPEGALVGALSIGREIDGQQPENDRLQQYVRQTLDSTLSEYGMSIIDEKPESPTYDVYVAAFNI
ncbi:hypothetical protein ACFL0V_02255 [Nanoarchaeota archaeon]